eukprot:11028011-Prorocentrum_lima.AAC.1
MELLRCLAWEVAFSGKLIRGTVRQQALPVLAVRHEVGAVLARALGSDRRSLIASAFALPMRC